jgi:hypothetical protein
MTDTTPAYSLLPWVRRGIASQISGTPSVNYATVPLSLSVNNAPVAAPPHVRLPGPGDVKSIDARAFIGTEPRDGADNFEPNFFAAIELATPDLPWMLTPYAPAGNRLTPWLCLIVLPDVEGVSIVAKAGALATLHIDTPLNPAAELPNLSQIDAWAHAHIAGADLSSAALVGDSGASLARLIAPRKLEASQRYIACVVPTFKAGLNAGLGIPVTDSDLTPSWDANITAPFKIPVYYQFRFQTGPGGDFASLARQIGPPTTPITGGTRTIDVSEPGFGAAAAPGATLQLEGALRIFNPPGTTWPDGAQAPYEAQLRKVLSPPVAADPVVTPPVFGKTQTNSDLPTADTQPPVWMGELNLDPRSRTIASAGGQVVQADSDAMVASAWDQLGQIRKANQLLRQAQLAREVTASLNRRHLQTMAGDGTYLQITSPTHSRVSLTLAGTTSTLFGHVQASRVPAGAISATMRKVARPRGPLGRQLAITGPQQMVDRLNLPLTSGPTAMVVAGPVKAPPGMVALDEVSPAIQMVKMTDVAVKAAPGWASTAVVVHPPTTAVEPPTTVVTHPVDTHPVVTDPVPAEPPAATTHPAALIDWSKDANVPAILQSVSATLPAPFVFPSDATALATVQHQFSTAAAAINGYLNTTQIATPDLPSVGGTPALATTRTQLSARLDPTLTIPARVKARVPLNLGLDPLQPLAAAPKFPQAMYEPLAALSPDWMLPGISSVPIDSAVLLQPNPRFVEAYMVGLNEELTRELLWKQFPAERTETWFQNFWSAGSTPPDIPAIAQFDPAGHLGDHTQDHANSGRVALLFHANLFRRYPNALVSAVQAVWNPPDSKGVIKRGLGTSRQWPIFQGQFGDDYKFFGFNIPDPFGKPDPAANDPGWYFVLEEHVTEPRFGLEPPGTVTATTNQSWNDLSWDHVSDGAALAGNFLTTTSAPEFTSIESVQWGENSASMAFILMRRPTRVAMHANALIAAEEA